MTEVLHYSVLYQKYFVPTFVPAIVLASVPAAVSAAMPALVTTPFSRPRSPAFLLFHYVPTLTTSAALFLPRYAPVFCRGIPAFLSPLSILGPTFLLGYLPIKMIKQSL